MNFVKCNFGIYWDSRVVFSFYLLQWWIIRIDFQMLTQFCIHGMKRISIKDNSLLGFLVFMIFFNVNPAFIILSLNHMFTTETRFLLKVGLFLPLLLRVLTSFSAVIYMPFFCSQTFYNVVFGSYKNVWSIYVSWNLTKGTCVNSHQT